MRATLLGVLLLLTIAILSCASAVTVSTEPDPAMYQDCRQSGPAAVSGETFGKTRGGDIKSAAGRRIHLDKFTPYSRDAFMALRKNGVFNEESEAKTFSFDPVMLRCRRTTTVDSTGHFSFQNIPRGNYFLSIYMVWMTQRGGWSGVWQVKLVHLGTSGQPDVQTGVVVY